jgi:hypothetical protein
MTTEKNPVKAEDVLEYLLNSSTIEHARDRSGRFTLKFQGNQRGNLMDLCIYGRIKVIEGKRAGKRKEDARTNMMVKLLEEGGDPLELIGKAKRILRERCVIDVDDSIIKDIPQPHEHADAEEDDWQSRGGN